MNTTLFHKQCYQETIVALATPPGCGGMGVVRVSGPLVPEIAEKILEKTPEPRRAYFCVFKDALGAALDQGILLYFKAPHSFTGEDVLELQGHGSPMILDLVLQYLLTCGARLARPGEFTERAFLNGKIDLVQAEAVADLIHAHSHEAARAALRSLRGAFSERITQLAEMLTQLRVYVEANLDFSEEEDVDLLQAWGLGERLAALLHQWDHVMSQARSGALLAEGAKVVLVGRPNAGKSSLLNRWAGYDAAIVTDIPGTTRDVLKETIALHGVKLQLIDTAGVHETSDRIEQEGIRRAGQMIRDADHVLVLVDGVTTPWETLDLGKLFQEAGVDVPVSIGITVLYNKIDVLGFDPRKEEHMGYTILFASVMTGEGMAAIEQHILYALGFRGETEGMVTARRRHLDALTRMRAHLVAAQQQWEARQEALCAEELWCAQRALGEITGQVSSDDLLGKIFSEFCIGK
jgi:tRNA modification GTPase